VKSSITVSEPVFAYLVSCYVSHRDLDSFPTRRSSDLLEVQVALGGRAVVDIQPQVVRRRVHHPPAVQLGFRVIGRGHDSPLAKRSEEHTSELQSRENLVCRLLLEKKNNKETKH